MNFRIIPALLAWAILLGSTGAFLYYIAPYIQAKYHAPVYLIHGVLTFFIAINFLLCECMDPGRLGRGAPEEFREEDPLRAPYIRIIQINDCNVRMKWCVTCQFYRPPRCSHCSVCGVCIETFDHHCPWINNCIGQGNYRHFFVFLISLSAHMLSVFGECVIYVLHHKETLKETPGVVALSLLFMIFFLSWPIVGLTIFHMILICKNRTTNEQMTGKFKIGENPYTEGCCRNCVFILCGAHTPICLRECYCFHFKRP